MLENNAPRHADTALTVELKEVSKAYGKHVALDSLSLQVRRGEIFGIIGANGGGKTTTLRILAGLISPDHGKGTVLGNDIVRQQDRIRSEIGYMPQNSALYGKLSVGENLHLRAALYGIPKKAVAEVMETYGLTRWSSRLFCQLSGGWKQRTQFAAAIIHSPELILLDEPTAGLDLVAQAEMWRCITELARQGASVVIATHDPGEAEACDKIAFYSNQKASVQGSPAQIRSLAAAQSGQAGEAIDLRKAAFILLKGDYEQ